jgi:hypothetical protein
LKVANIDQDSAGDSDHETNEKNHSAPSYDRYVLGKTQNDPVNIFEFAKLHSQDPIATVSLIFFNLLFFSSKKRAHRTTVTAFLLFAKRALVIASATESW